MVAGSCWLTGVFCSPSVFWTSCKGDAVSGSRWTHHGRSVQAAAEHQCSRKRWGDKVILMFKWSRILLQNLWLSISVKESSCCCHERWLHPYLFPCSWGLTLLTSAQCGASCSSPAAEHPWIFSLTALARWIGTRLTCHLSHQWDKQASPTQQTEVFKAVVVSPYKHTHLASWKRSVLASWETPLWCYVASHCRFEC